VADENRSPLAIRYSILSYADGRLGALAVGDGYEIRHEDRVLGWLDEPRLERAVRCITRGSEWTLTRSRTGNTEVTTGTAVVARYKSSVLPGGTLELPDESRFRLRRPSMTGVAWSLRRGRREVVLELRPMRDGWEIQFEPAAREIHQLPLVAMLALYAVVVEAAQPNMGGAPGPLGP
jgi:hypothetical protein